MNLKNIKDYWHLLEAAKEGKVIQYKTCVGWEDIDDPSFEALAENYRVKPEPVVREVWVNIYSDGTGGLVHLTEDSAREAIKIRRGGDKTAYLYTRIEDGVMVEQKLIPVGN